MKEIPILFNTPMVRALLEGRKTQTRRIVKPQPDHRADWLKCDMNDTYRAGIKFGEVPQFGHWKCPYGKPGDRLWVRETWTVKQLCSAPQPPVYYYASYDPCPHVWRPSIFMPRWASRITLEVVSVRVERLQEITEEDARAEGCEKEFEASAADFLANKNWDAEKSSTYRLGYKHLWESINGPGSWAANPLVWVIEFRRVSA